MTGEDESSRGISVANLARKRFNSTLYLNFSRRIPECEKILNIKLLFWLKPAYAEDVVGEEILKAQLFEYPLVPII